MAEVHSWTKQTEDLLTFLGKWEKFLDGSSSSLELQSPDSVPLLKHLRSVEQGLASSLYKTRRAINATVPIHKLPHDIMKLIFECLSSPVSGDFNPYPPTTFHHTIQGNPASSQFHLYQWMRVCAVCHYWRDVALSTSTLWSSVSIGPAKTPNAVFDMQLSRSGDAPIDLHLSYENMEPEMNRIKKFDWADVDLRSIVPRLRGFHVHTNPQIPGHSSDDFFAQLSVPAPLLEHLTIGPVTFDRYWNVVHTPEMRNMYILPTLFQGSTPRLRDLTLGGFISWPGNDFRDLTRLCIRDQREATQRNPLEPNLWTQSTLLDLLSASPLLEELVIENCLHLTPDTGGPRGVLCLPRLSSLTLRSWPADSFHLFLTSLEVPPVCKVQLDAQAFPRSELLDAVCDPLCLSNLAACLENITRVYLHSPSPGGDLSILGCGSSGLHLTGLAAPTPIHWEDNDEILAGPNGAPIPAPMSPVLGPYTHLPVSDTHGTRLYSAMNIKELWVDTHDRLNAPASEWHHLYNAMPHVEKLVVIDRTWAAQTEATFDCLEALALQPFWMGTLEVTVVSPAAATGRVCEVLRRIHNAREQAGYRAVWITLKPMFSLPPSESELQYIHDMLGPDIHLNGVDVDGSSTRFDQRPFGDGEVVLKYGLVGDRTPAWGGPETIPLEYVPPPDDFGWGNAIW